MIKESRSKFKIRMMCKLLGVSVSGYYEWAQRSPSKRENENNMLAEKIKEIYDIEKQRAASIRITRKLRQGGRRVSRNRIARIMRKKGWRAKGATDNPPAFENR